MIAKSTAYANLSNYNHNTYGGEIDIEDFNTECCNGNTIDKIVEALKFDKKCKYNCEKRRLQKRKDEEK